MSLAFIHRKQKERNKVLSSGNQSHITHQNKSTKMKKIKNIIKTLRNETHKIQEYVQKRKITFYKVLWSRSFCVILFKTTLINNRLWCMCVCAMS